MRNLLAFFAAALLTFGGLGWYLGWYRIQSNPAPLGHHSYNVDLDGKKITEDLQRGEEKLHDALNKRRTEDAGQDAEKSKTISVQPAAK